ncbi:ABC transporter substrate-binding protein [Rhizobium calliandrae]|uniref:sn-glycerol-3-phosphate-binding periplasmic protein UgpB n=1 Tax=Rhizobium calliandrae TaxID=1312182 RepID=A0ABT7KP66_9HYPH|nr:ABC transporter substrate-binding protein [Rhizobium calliandrae]MDL2409805.1 ABC transporter substrate-binding protein [Rhizobium calliandrae]
MLFRSLRLVMPLLALAASSAQAETLNVLYVKGSFPEEIVEPFKKAHPDINVILQTPATDYDDLTKRLLQDSIVGETPDVIFQGYNRSLLTVQRGLPVPLESILAGDANWVRENYEAASNDLCRHDGKQYGLPFIISVPIVYYNPDLVKAAGEDPDHFPGTWEGITELAGKITATGNNRIGGYFDHSASGNWTFMALINAQGGQIMSADDRKIEFDGAEGKKALDVIEMFGKAGQVDMPRTQASQGFSAGSIGILVSSSGFLKSLMKQANFQVRTAPFPISENGHMPAGGNCMMLLSKDAEQQKAAWTFMKFMASPQVQAQVFEATGYLPGNRLGAADPLKEAKPDDPRLVSVAASAKAGTWYSFPGDNSLRITETIKSVLQDVATLRLPPAEALPKMRQDVQALLPR